MNELVRFLATELMGWEKGVEQVGDIQVAVWHKDGIFTGFYTDIRKPEYFDPVNDVAHAFTIVEKMGEKYGFLGKNGFTLINFGASKKDWYCEFPKPTWSDAQRPTPAEAITIAAARALGYKELEK